MCVVADFPRHVKINIYVNRSQNNNKKDFTVLKGTDLRKSKKVFSLTWLFRKMLINRGYDIVPEAAAECSEGAEADVGANNPVFCGGGGVIPTC